MRIDHGPHTTSKRTPAPYVHSPAWSGRPTEDLTWQEQSRCASTDPDLFHPEQTEGHGQSAMAAIIDAKKVCRPCPVRAACLVYALTTKQRYGVWGGEGRRGRTQILDSFPDREAPAPRKQKVAA